MPETLSCDVCVVGGGSGGIGAALASSRAGVETILVEKNQFLGGTSTAAWVHVWQPSVGGGGMPKEIFQRMKAHPYALTLRDYSKSEPRRGGAAICWEPFIFNIVVTGMLRETNQCTMHLGSTFIRSDVENHKIKEIQVQDGSTRTKIRARVFIDATADGDVAVSSGCLFRMGEEPKSEFNEPGAPKKAGMHLNSITLMYRMRPTGKKQNAFLPEGARVTNALKGTALQQCPNGDYLVNVLDMIPEGHDLFTKGYAAVMDEAMKKIILNFYYLQTEKGCDDYVIVGVAPELGVRESRRIVGEYTLNENDVQRGRKRGKHDDVVTVTDHAVDIHGVGHTLYEVPNGPYGIPYRCLLPKWCDNLLVASRAASFTHIAASSARLSRTIMTLGQAAGNAAAMAVKARTNPRHINVKELRERLSDQGVELG
jgi:hypothetical protein